MLLLAALGCIAALLATYVSGAGQTAEHFDMRHVSLIALVACSCLIAGLMVWHMTTIARHEARYAKAESMLLRRNLAAADALKQAGARGVYLAGRPGEFEAAWRKAGVDGFIFAGSDVLAALQQIHATLGIK